MSGIVFRQSVIAVLCFIIGVSAQAQTTMTTGTDWNTGGNWDSGVPSGAINAVVNSGISANVNSGSTPSYSGSLTLQSSATVTIQNNAADVNAISGSSIIMNTGSEVSMGNQANPLVLPAITMLGNAIMNNGPNNPSHHRTRDYSGAITGAGILTMEGNNNITVNLNVSNSFAELVLSKPDGRTNWRVDAEVAGALGWGDVTVEDTITLRIHAANAMDDSGALYLVGGRDTKLSGSYSKLHMTANDTIDKLFIDGFQALSGSYTSSESWLSGSGTLTVNTDPVDSTPPTVVSIVDNFGGGPIYEDISTVLYTVTFDEDIDNATVSAADFDNAGTATATVGSVTKTTSSPAPAVYTVELLPTSTGTLILRIPAGATIDDALGNSLVVPLQDPDTITINAGSSPPSIITGTASGPGGSDDNWNNAANWDTGVIPVSSLSAVIGSGVNAQVDNASSPAYTGTLTISNNATVRINTTAGSESVVEGPPSITMHPGSKISLACGFQVDFPAITLAGNASFDNPSNASDNDTRNFNGVIDGSGTLTLNGRNNVRFRLKAANTFTGDLICDAVDRWYLHFDAAGSAGAGDVTINGRSGDNRSARIEWGAANAMADTATLNLNGGGYTGDGSQRITMTQSDTIFALFLDGVQQDGGTYTSADSFISGGGGTLTVIDYPAAITNNSAVNEATTSADLVSTLSAPNEIFDIYAYWSTNDNADSTAWLADVAASNALVGSYSNIVAITNSATGLTPATIYYYTMRGSNALEQIWATPNASFVTPGVAAPPTVTVDGGATNIGIGAAQLRGLLTAGGAADAFICWGESDAGTSSTNSWDNVVTVAGGAIQGVSFSTDVTDLFYGLEYEYRVYVTNGIGDDWSGLATFMTLPPESSPDLPIQDSLELWLDSNDVDGGGDGATGDPAVGANITTWVDKSGNLPSRDATDLQSDPAVANGPNSTRVIAFDSGDRIATTHSFQPAQYTMFGVSRYAGAAKNRVIASRDTNFLFGHHGSKDERWYANGWIHDTGNNNENWHIYMGHINNSDQATFAKDGTTLTSNDTGANGSTYKPQKIQLNGYNGGSELSDSEIAEVILYNRVLNASEINLVGAYLEFKYAVGSSYSGYSPDPAIAITNTAAANIAATSADLVGTLDATQSVFTVTAFYSTNNNASSAAWLADGDALSASAGTYTNVLGQSVVASVSSLTSQKTYYYAMRAVNASTNLWALPNASFTTLAPAVPPTVTVGGGVTDVGVGTATLRGLLTAGIFANASVYWGATDGGTSTSAWENVIDAGVAAESTTFSNAVSGLLYGIAYHYRVYVTNSAGEDWSSLDTFTTVAPLGGFSEATGWSYAAWTDDADSGVDSARTYTAAHSFGNNNGSVSVNGISFAEGFANSGSGWSIGGSRTDWNGDDDATITGESEKIAQEFVYNGSPRTVQMSGLTASTRYRATFYSVGWEASGRVQTFSSSGDDLVLDQDFYGNNAGITISYVFDAGGATQDFTITPSGGSFHMYALSNRDVELVPGIGIDNTAAANITDATADLGGALDATQSVFTVTAFFSTNNNANSAAWLADGDASSVVAGVYTNVLGQSVVASTSGLDPLTTYYYTLRASNAATNLWATPNSSFTTFATQVAPTVDNAGGPTAVLDVSATLNGNMSAGGVATAYIVWGTSVPGSPLDTNAWANVETIGSVSDGTLFSTNVSGLAALTTYYYRCFVTNAVGGAWSVVTNFATTVAVNTMIAETDWNTAGNWDKAHVPIGNENVIVGAGLTANVNSGATPAYTGSLTLQNNALLRLYSNSDLNALGGAAQTITMNTGSKVLLRMGNTTIAQPFHLDGAATIQGGESTAGHHGTHNFTGVFSGSGSLAFRGVNNDTYQLSTSNTFNGLSTETGSGSNFRVDAYAAGALGVGDVSITNSTSLRLFAADAIADVATLSLDGGRDTKLSATYDKLHVTVGNTVSNLYIDGLHKQAGVYDNTEAWLSGAGTLTVLDGPPPTAPEIDPSDFVDDVFGGPIYEDHPYYPITYTLTFDRDMDDTTVSGDDFENSGTAAVAITNAVEISDGVFTLEVTPSGSGTVNLQIKAGADLREAGGAALDTASAIADDTTITIIAGSPPVTTISGTAGGSDSWNTSGNWDNGVPYGNQSAVVTPGITVQVGGASTPYAGDLTFGANATFRVNTGTDVNVLPEAGSTITFNGNGTFDMLDAGGWGSGFVVYADVVLGGNLLIDNRGNGSHHETRVFSGAVSGTGGITMDSDNNNILRFAAANTFSGGVTVINANSYLEATADGALGIGSVTIGNATSLKIGSGLSDTINDHASLNLNGTKDSGEAGKVVMGSSETIKRLYLDGVLQERGTYGAISSGADNESATFSGSGILTVLNGPPRTIFLFK